MKKIFISALVVLILTGSAIAGPTITKSGTAGFTDDGVTITTSEKLTVNNTLTANAVATGVSADATLSGTPIIITIYDKATNTPYYFKAYPTKP